MQPPGNAPSGKPPRSIEQIRAAVQSIQNNTATAAAPGPLKAGLAGDERIVVASFQDRARCEAVQQRLLAAGIMSAIEERRKQTLLSVDLDDRSRAAEIFDQYQADHPERPVVGHRRAFDMTIFGSLIGGTLAFCMQGGEAPSWTRSTLLIVGCLVLGGLTGSFFDVSRNHYRRTGRLQFGLGALMVVMAMIAVGFLLWRILGTSRL